MLRFCLVCVALISSIGVYAQYGNEWIDPTQPYYFKIPVAENGIYRLTYNDLNTAGFPITQANYQKIQLFHRGVEQNLYVHKVNPQSSSFLEPGDYIEFYGIQNDGRSDSVLYSPTSAQPHQYYNLFSDTTSYFLTFLTDPVGRARQVTETGIANPTGVPEVYHLGTRMLIYSDEYSEGIQYQNPSTGSYTVKSSFDSGEGWTGAFFPAKGVSNVKSIKIDGIANTFQSGPVPELEILLQGRGMVKHDFVINIGPTGSGRQLTQGSFNNTIPYKITVPIAWSDIAADGSTTVEITASPVSPGTNRISVSYMKLTYPQVFDAATASQETFQLVPNGEDSSYVEIQNPPAGARLFDITDADSFIPITTSNTGILKALVANGAAPRKLMVVGSGAIRTPSIKPVQFVSYDGTQSDYVIISHSLLMKSAGGYDNVVQAYADYRATQAGGGYQPLVADIQQLYDQFNYGEQSPVAIRRFMKFMIDNSDPKYLFLIGKGLDVNIDYFRNPNSTMYKNLVPTAGMPGSDILFTSGYNGTEHQPAVSTGRITTVTPAQVANYLNKVKETEALPFNDLRRKNVFHLSGGLNDWDEVKNFRDLLATLTPLAEGDYLGGKVTSQSKSDLEIENINVSDKINDGVALITTLGHSSPGTSDINIGFVSSPELGYDNPGKYPMFLINGCNAGEFFNKSTLYGEDWINAAKKGAIAFIANTSLGDVGVLNRYAREFYLAGLGDSTLIHRGIGDVLKRIATRLEFISTIDMRFAAQVEQNILLGDPAVSLFGASKPDYAVDNSSAWVESFNGEPITVLSDSFAIKIAIKNFGRTLEDSLAIRVTRTFNDNTFVTYDSLYPQVFYHDTVTFVIPRDVEKGYDNNEFRIELDPDLQINELDEDNNEVELTVFIPSYGVRNLYPQDFSIVSSLTTNLVIQSTDLLGEAREFLIELDTVPTFDSNYLQQFSVTGKIATQEAELLDIGIDTIAYYWHVKFAKSLDSSESDEWTASTFTYIKGGPEGWAQVRFPQYQSNELNDLLLDNVSQRIRLKETVANLDILTGGSGIADVQKIVSVKINGAEYNPQSLEKPCRNNTINLIAFSKTSTTPYVSIVIQQSNEPLDFRACGVRPEVIASFKSSELELTSDAQDLTNYIEEVAEGDSVVLFSIGDPGFSTPSWSANVWTKLGELGILKDQITGASGIMDGEPMVILGKKGAAPGSAKIIKSAVPGLDAQLDVSETITGRATHGIMTSGLIGPAQSWQSLVPSFRETEAKDIRAVDIWGHKLNGETQLLMDSLADVTDLSSIDASVYPYLQLKYYTADTINLTAPQLRNWVVAYTPVAEGVLQLYESSDRQTLSEGEIWNGSYGFINISTQEFQGDSLRVVVDSFNKNAKGTYSGEMKILSPLPGETTTFEVSVPTLARAGLNDLNVFVNPRTEPEVYYDNNLLQLRDYLSVQADVFAPVLEVTFDGRVIEDGDHVSKSPVIRATLWDENQFLPKVDTAGIKIFLESPCEFDPCIFEPVYLNRDDVTVSPADGQNNFYVEFHPADLTAGSYKLQVEATDVAGNPSSDKPYVVRFMVTDETGLVIERPYPNPSLGPVHFRMVVLGDQIPELVTLNIIAADGRAVSESNYTEFFVGSNDLVWAGHDNMGNELPSGIYLYRLSIVRVDKSIKTMTGRIVLSR